MFKLKQLFVKQLKKNSDRHIQWALNRFADRHPGQKDPALQEKLEKEAIRVNALVEDSIVQERITRSFWIFLITALAVTLVTVFTGGFGAVLTAAIPIASAIVAALASIVTINLSCSARQKGAMRSVLELHESEVAANGQKKGLTPDMPISKPKEKRLPSPPSTPPVEKDPASSINGTGYFQRLASHQGMSIM